jgi:hypothetical protein
MTTSMDIAILYFGLTRSTKKVFYSHKYHITDILEKNNMTYKIFMHTWKTNDDTQNVLGNKIQQKIDYTEYKLLHPDIYKIDNQDDFLASIDISHYFYKDVLLAKGSNKDGEWNIDLIKNHLCALESMKRGLEMIPDTFRYVMFIRPDIMIFNELPIQQMLQQMLQHKISIPNNNHYEGLNDRFAMMNYKNALIYGKRIDELAEYRKSNGRIVSEKYVKFIVNKYKIPVNLIDFNFNIIRP